MTQQPDIHDEEWTPPSSGVLRPLAKERALARIGYSVTTKRRGTQIDWWAVLNWFVRLANEDVAETRPEKLREKQSEYRALQEVSIWSVRSGGFDNVPPSLVTFLQLQATVKTHLAQLVDQGRLSLGPFPVNISIFCPSKIPGANEVNHLSQRVYSGEHYAVMGVEAMAYLMARCLEHCGDMLRKCLYCQKLFLQERRVRSLRRERVYCSDVHRALASRKRKAERLTTIQKSRKKKAGGSSKPSRIRRRVSHGKKRR
jgi:hypothetical protein